MHVWNTFPSFSSPTLHCLSLPPLSIPAPVSPFPLGLSFCSVTCCCCSGSSLWLRLGLSHGAWRVHLWAHSWRQWLSSPPSDLWALPHPRRTVGRSNLVRARARHYRCCDFMIAIAMSSPEDGICGRLPVFWFSHPFCSVSCSLPEP